MVLPDGTSQPLAQMHIRATEYTVGAAGPQNDGFCRAAADECQRIAAAM